MQVRAWWLGLALTGCADGEPTAPAREAAGWAHLPDRGGLTAVAPEALADAMIAPSGKGRVVNLWATWCPPCLRELPELAAFARDREDVELVLVLVDPPERLGLAATRLSELGLAELPVLHLGADPAEPAVASAIPEWPETLPWTAVIGADGSRQATFPFAITAADLTAVLPPPAPTVTR